MGEGCAVRTPTPAWAVLTAIDLFLGRAVFRATSPTPLESGLDTNFLTTPLARARLTSASYLFLLPILLFLFRVCFARARPCRSSQNGLQDSSRKTETRVAEKEEPDSICNASAWKGGLPEPAVV